MRHFLFVGDPGGTSTNPRPREVLGVWCVEALKAQHAEYEFGGLEPDLVAS